MYASGMNEVERVEEAVTIPALSATRKPSVIPVNCTVPVATRFPPRKVLPETVRRDDGVVEPMPTLPDVDIVTVGVVVPAVKKVSPPPESP